MPRKQKNRVVYEGCRMESWIAIIKDDNNRSLDTMQGALAIRWEAVSFRTL